MRILVLVAVRFAAFLTGLIVGAVLAFRFFRRLCETSDESVESVSELMDFEREKL
jgi:hypothetical protein